jgi:hypothetical protein
VFNENDEVFRTTRVAARTPAGDETFRSTTIASGEELSVLVTVVIPDVPMAPGSGLFFDDIWVGYDVLGTPRHQRVPLGFRVLVRAADGQQP